jgi:hypothetical protein
VRRFAGALPYLAWAVSSAFTVLDWAVLRTTIVAIADRISKLVPIEEQAARGWLLQWPVAAVDQVAVLGLGAIGLGLVVAYDYLYRGAMAKGRLRKRFLTITAIQAGVLALCGIILAVLRIMTRR